jgi:hypothetical protein
VQSRGRNRGYRIWPLLRIVNQRSGANEGKSLTVVDRSDRVQARTGSHKHDRSAFSLVLQVVSSQCSSIDNAVQVNVQGILVWLFQVAVLVSLEGKIVGTWADSSVDEDMVDPAMLVLCDLEEFRQVNPFPDISLYEEEIACCWRCLDVAAYYQGAERYQELNCSKANTR